MGHISAATALGAVLLLSGCTEPTWYPGLPSAVVGGLDSGGTDGDTSTDGGTDGGTDTGSAGDGGTDTGSTGDGGTDSGGDPLPCSDPGFDAATLTIDLQHDLGLILWWRAEDCTEYSYGAVPPYVPRDQGTYIGHVWVLRDAVGRYHDHLTVTEPTQLWEVPE